MDARMASIVFNNFNDFVSRCRETIVNDINWEAMILKVLVQNSEIIVNNRHALTTDKSQEEANPAANTLPSESTTSSCEMSLLHSSGENLDNEIEAQLYDVKYNQIDVGAIDEREEEVEIQERSPDHLRSQSLTRNEEILPSVQEEELSEQFNRSVHWDFQNSQIENQGCEESLEEYENISYFVPEIEIREEDPMIDPIGEESTAMQPSVSKMNSKIRKQQQTSLNGFRLDHSIFNTDVFHHNISSSDSRRNHKDCTPGRTMKKSLRQHPCNEKGCLKDNRSTSRKKSTKKRKIGEVIQAGMSKAPRKKLRVNFTDVEETIEVPQVQQSGPYVSLPRLSKVDVLEIVRSLRQRTYMPLNIDTSGSSSYERYRCKICNQRSKSKSGLLRHHIYRHTDEKPYKCPHCPKSFKDPGDVKQHTRGVHKLDMSYNPASSKNLRNNFTGEKKRTAPQVKEAGSCLPVSHSSKIDPLKTVHSLRPRNCISVNYADNSTVASSKKLEIQTVISKINCTDRGGRHVEPFHGEKKSTGKIEKTKLQKNESVSALRKENITSDNDGSSHTKGYCCEICHHWLKTKSTLQKHTFRQHPDHRLYHCKYKHCSESFKDLCDMKTHIWNVHKFQRHQCDRCCSSFKYRQNLLRHIQNVHEQAKK